MKYLILSLLIVGCASTPQPTKFDVKWEFIEKTPGQPPMACLSKKDVEKLNELRVLNCRGQKRVGND